MRRYADLTITDAAVHLVAPNASELACSTAALVLDDAVRQFLEEHVTKGLADNSALAARFRVLGPDRAEGCCRDIIEGLGIVDPSAKLARHLYEASRSETATDARVSDGALVVARCGATDGAQGATTFLALLKLDPNDAFRAEETRDRTGARSVSLVRQPNTLPSPRERLQKAAFVRAAGDEYDALVVDKQRRGVVVSAYFLDGFLGLEHVADAAERTREMHRVLLRGFDEVKDELSEDQYAQADQYLHGALVARTVDVDVIVAGTPGPAVVRDHLAQLVATELPDRVFETDPDVTARLTKRRSFKGAQGLRVSIFADAYDDMINVQPPTAPNEDYVITIRTQTWGRA